MRNDIIITAGGLGRRLWPVSTYEKPKQFMSLEGNISFFQSTILRAQKMHNDGYIVIVSRQDLYTICFEQIEYLVELLSDNRRQNLLDRLILILEPSSKGTANSVLFAMHCLRLIHEEASSITLLPSDHIIGPFESFRQDIQKGSHISLHDKIVCYGIAPPYPTTSYGYIGIGDALPIDTTIGITPDNPSDTTMYDNVYHVVSFHEKPDLETAKQFLETEKYFWNTAIYTFPSALIFNEYKLFQPELYNSFNSISKESYNVKVQDGIQTLIPNNEIRTLYETTQNVSFEFAIIADTQHSCIIKSDFSWEDVGNWDSFSSLFSPPKTEKIIEIEGKNNFVYSDIPVALCGVENISVIIKNGQALILQKGKSELVKKVFD